MEEDGLLDDPPPLSFDPRRFDNATISFFVLTKIYMIDSFCIIDVKHMTS